MNKKYSIQELLDAGVTVAELLEVSKPSEVTVEVSTDRLAQIVDNSLQKSNSNLDTVKLAILKQGEANKDLFIKAVAALLKANEKEKNEVKGVKFIRDEFNLISELEFIRG